MSAARPEPGDIWEDADKRASGRLMRIDRVENWRVFGTVIENPRAPRMIGRPFKADIARFDGSHRGYRWIGVVAKAGAP